MPHTHSPALPIRSQNCLTLTSWQKELSRLQQAGDREASDYIAKAMPKVQGASDPNGYK